MMRTDHGWELPDPFLKEDGTRIADKQEWPRQRARLRKLLEEHFYGTVPGRPENMKSRVLETSAADGTVRETVRLMTGPGAAVCFNIHASRKEGMKAAPCVVFLQHGWDRPYMAEAALKKGYAFITLEIGEAAPDDPLTWNKGGCGKAYPDFTWRSVAMWGWLESRVIDWLETEDFCDPGKIIVTGHSRMGKGTCACGVFDDRPAVVAPAGSGCGGMASLRLSGSRLGEGVGMSERIGIMLREDRFFYWLTDEAASYGSPDGLKPYRENECPYDANTIGAVIAPKPLILTEGADDTWINPYGTQTAWLAAGEVYRFLGAPELLGIRYREGGHMYADEDFDAVLRFAGKVFGEETDIGNIKTAGKEGPEFKAGYSWSCPL